ncbi:MAG: bifunctional glutamate N-acetyltransferase/amino-acid acetyltransferase ArgJ [Aggregatilineales bacterium]
MSVSNVSTVIDTIPGFRVASVDAGLRKQPAPDLTLIAADRPCVAAGVFTTNRVQAAPVILDRARIEDHPDRIRAVLINAGIANACTGDEGRRNAEQSAAWTAEALGCAADEVLVMSTGVIGVQLPMDKLRGAIPLAAGGLRPDSWQNAAHGIMTTDTKPKMASVSVNGYTIAGIAKGAGMIAPNMATMLCAIVTDAEVSPKQLRRSLRQAVEPSFNQIVIDGDTSTNDTVLLLANGASGVKIGDDAKRFMFTGALYRVCKALAQAVVHDGEGVTRFITLHVTHAESPESAHQIANTIATSPLVKTAFYGGDANWGRLFMAAGRAGVELQPEKLSLWYEAGECLPGGGLQLVANGTPLNYDDAQANAIAGRPEVTVTLDLGLGDAASTVWTCDLSHEYVSINGHYRT